MQEGYHLVEIDADLSLDGKLQRALRVTTQQSNWQWLDSGKVEEKGSPSSWLIRLQPTTLPGDTFRLDLMILRGDPDVPEAKGDGWRGNARLVAKPALIVKAGEPARIEVSDDKDGQVLRLDLNTHWVISESLGIVKPVVDRPQP